MKTHSLASLLHAFFHEWMGKQRNLSRHTVCSYRDTWKLFLRFVSAQKRREVAELSLTDLQAGEVLAFLTHLENIRKVGSSAESVGADKRRMPSAARVYRIEPNPEAPKIPELENRGPIARRKFLFCSGLEAYPSWRHPQISLRRRILIARRSTGSR